MTTDNILQEVQSLSLREAIIDFMTQSSKGKQSDVELFFSRNKVFIRKKTKPVSPERAVEIIGYLKEYFKILRSITTGFFAYSIDPYVFYSEQEGMIIIEEEFIGGINIESYIKVFVSNVNFPNERKILIVSTLVRLMLNELFKIERFEREYFIENHKVRYWLKPCGFDWKPANFVLEGGRLILIDTFAPKLWNEDRTKILTFPEYDEESSQTITLLCGNLETMVGRIFRLITKLLKELIGEDEEFLKLYLDDLSNTMLDVIMRYELDVDWPNLIQNEFGFVQWIYTMDKKDKGAVDSI
jgi:hypothetical protein